MGKARSKCETSWQEQSRQVEGLVGGKWWLVREESRELGRAQGIGRILQIIISNLVNSK